MNLIVIGKNARENDLLRFAISSRPIAELVLEALSLHLNWLGNGSVIYAVPQDWGVVPAGKDPLPAAYDISPTGAEHKMMSYRPETPISLGHLGDTEPNSWSTISSGRFATRLKEDIIRKVLARTSADLVAINVDPQLLAYREKVRLTTRGRVAGFRRCYRDCAEPTPLGGDWPHQLFVRTAVLDQLLTDSTLPQSFPAFVQGCRSKRLPVAAVSVAGAVWDLQTKQGLLNLCADRLRLLSQEQQRPGVLRSTTNANRDNGNVISEDAKFIGPVLLGDNVHISQKVVVVGPTIIADNARIATDTVIDASLIGPGVSVAKNQLVQNCIVYKTKSDPKILTGSTPNRPVQTYALGPHFNHGAQRMLSNNVLARSGRWENGAFRQWSRLSYAGCFKRLVDFFIAAIVLILFAPVLPFVALAIKLTSPGPVFFKDRRQGLRGGEFNCLKFRSMIAGSDRMQEKLRVANQADGPQFKITDDPRLSSIGKFLRDTYIDEIPQFFNVLLGQMSIVGPRPSPGSENTLCPSWRDARLSVRPGITGLWQVCRTRRLMKDFQEWIHYDIKYVENLSLKLDLWICWQTAKKMLKSFIRQF
ncbi:MAG: sugar transferase [Planctomycetota bacterium]|jgi:lipopolysaccharide/colanic/teichoic acid biosynthesis glycosyltransferase